MFAFAFVTHTLVHVRTGSYVSVGRPVVIKGALRDCKEALRLWSKENVRKSELANVAYVLTMDW